MRMRDTAYSADCEIGNAYRHLAGKPESKRPLARPKCRWVDNV
jgi:hypothetical protein